MNYAKIYDDLIHRSKERGWSKKTAPVRVEMHHIVPRGMGGTDKKSNIACLTIREHVMAHLLLAKAHGGRYWQIAYGIIRNRHGRRIHTRALAMIKANAHAIISERMKGNRNGACATSEETKRKISESRRGIFPINCQITLAKNWEKARGSIQSEAANAKRSASAKSNGFVPVKAGDFETSSKGGKMNKGNPKPPRSEVHRSNLSKAQIGKVTQDSKSVCADGVMYDTMANAARALGVTRDAIRHRCRSAKYNHYYFTTAEVIL